MVSVSSEQKLVGHSSKWEWLFTSFEYEKDIFTYGHYIYYQDLQHI